MSYPPPTLIKRRSRSAWARYAVLLFTLALVLGTCTASRFMGSEKHVAAPSEALDAPLPTTPAADASVVAPAPAPADEVSDAPATASPAVKIAEAPPPPVAAPVVGAAAPVAVVAAPAPVAPAAAGIRTPNHWYYVRALGDGPGAIYSGSGTSWDYAFACTKPTRMIEFIAVRTGDPGGFQDQMMSIGASRLNLDATYSTDQGGTISARLPARNSFLDGLTDGATLNVQLVANRSTALSIGADVARVIRDCRGH